MPTPSEPEAARASRAATKHARRGPGKAGPLPPCFLSTPHHATALPVKGKDPKPKGFCSEVPGLNFSLLALLSFHFGLFGFDFGAFLPFGLVFLSFWPLGL